MADPKLLDGLFGIDAALAGEDPKTPRRKTLQFEGTGVGWELLDDPDTERTIVRAVLGGSSAETSIDAGLTANQNDWAPTGWAAARIVRVTPTDTWAITGFSATGLTQPRKTLINLSTSITYSLTLDAAGSSAANRIAAPHASVNYAVPARGSLEIFYDVTASRWRILEVAYPLPTPGIGSVPFSLDGVNWVLAGAPAATITANSNQSLTLAAAWNWIVPSQSALTANRDDTLSTAGAVEGDVVSIFWAQSNDGGFHRSIINGGPAAGTLYSAPNTGQRVVDFQFDGVNWAKLGQKRWFRG